MKKNNILTHILAWIGTVLVSLPIFAPILFSVLALLHGGGLHFDYLMPAELFIFILAGGAVLIWAALRKQLYSKQLIWGAAAAIATLAGSQSLAVASGLASGTREASGVWWMSVLALLGIYLCACVWIWVHGVRLLRSLQS